ncbi:MAG: hypothetical protein US81_C0006G0025 [Parcubacteria group bacterium GW2011_GWE2_38_18]|nr:MAG: hypothetical protein US81_C0006G0025 [Parcubacteria group bacterium GW2011_GWE2_38_18]
MRESIIHDKLDHLQFSSTIENGKFLVIKTSDGGYGAQLTAKVLGMKLAYIFNRTILFDDASSCYLDCYKPTSNLSLSGLGDYKKIKFDFNQKMTDKVVYLNFYDYWNDKNHRINFEKWLPDELKKESISHRYFVGQLLQRFELKTECKNYIEEKKLEIGFKTPIIGMHIRRGDKNTESPYIPIRIFEHYLKKASKNTNIRRVFVTSDSEKILDQLPKISGIQYIFDKNEKRYDNANEEMLKNSPEIRRQETLTALKIIELLSDCNHIVGQINTHFTNLASCLNIAKNGKENNVSYVNRDYNDTYLNNDPNPFFYFTDIIRKFGHKALLHFVRKYKSLIFTNEKIYNKLKSIYYRRKI